VSVVEDNVAGRKVMNIQRFWRQLPAESRRVGVLPSFRVTPCLCVQIDVTPAILSASFVATLPQNPRMQLHKSNPLQTAQRGCWRL